MSFNSDPDYPSDAQWSAAKGKIANRKRARALVMQALYQWQLAGQTAAEIEAQFRLDNDFSHIDGSYFSELLSGIAARYQELDALFVPYLDRPVQELDPVELAILRLSSFELHTRLEVPYRVVINEGIELAKTYGATDGHKFVNGVLDQLAVQLRAVEVRAHIR